MRFKVTYTVRITQADEYVDAFRRETEPYELLGDALVHARDIAGYQGISNVLIVPVGSDSMTIEEVARHLGRPS